MKQQSRQQRQKKNHDQAVYALGRSTYWLQEANRLLEAGKEHTKAYQEAERKAVYWLAKTNDHEGINT